MSGNFLRLCIITLLLLSSISVAHAAKGSLTTQQFLDRSHDALRSHIASGDIISVHNELVGRHNFFEGMKHEFTRPFHSGCSIYVSEIPELIDDSDCDGIPDTFDSCPYTPDNGVDVNQNGIADVCDVQLMSLTVAPSSAFPGRYVEIEVRARDGAGLIKDGHDVQVVVEGVPSIAPFMLPLRQVNGQIVGKAMIRIPECLHAGTYRMRANLVTTYGVETVVFPFNVAQPADDVCGNDVVESPILQDPTYYDIPLGCGNDHFNLTVGIDNPTEKNLRAVFAPSSVTEAISVVEVLPGQVAIVPPMHSINFTTIVDVHELHSLEQQFLVVDLMVNDVEKQEVYVLYRNEFCESTQAQVVVPEEKFPFNPASLFTPTTVLLLVFIIVVIIALSDYRLRRQLKTLIHIKSRTINK